jgi:hypothetical protein
LVRRLVPAEARGRNTSRETEAQAAAPTRRNVASLDDCAALANSSAMA